MKKNDLQDRVTLLENNIASADRTIVELSANLVDVKEALDRSRKMVSMLQSNHLNTPVPIYNSARALYALCLYTNDKSGNLDHNAYMDRFDLLPKEDQENWMYMFCNITQGLLC